MKINKGKILIKLLMCLLFFVIIAESRAEMLIEDNFDKFDNKIWQELPTGAAISNGTLIEKGRGGITLISQKAFKYKTFETKMKFNSLKANYYIGFIRDIPWNESACWNQISGNALECRMGNKGAGDSIGSFTLEADKWYIFKIVWSEEKIIFFIDDRQIGETDFLKIIPTSSLKAVIATLTEGPEGVADIEVDWVKVTGESDVEKKEDRKSDAGTKPLTIENNFFIQQFSLGQGAVLNKINNKKTNVDYLALGQKSPLFVLILNGEPLSSSEMKVEDFNIKEDGQKKTLQIRLSSKESPIRAELLCKWSETEESIWSLKLINQSKESVKVKTIFPIFENLQIDEKLDDNFYFYPFDGGWCGKSACSLVSEYPGVLWMQVMSVFNPKVESGMYIYSKDNTGHCKGLILKKASTSPEEKTIKQHHAWYADAYPTEYDFNDETIALAIYYPEEELLPDSSFSPPDMVIGIHKGDWKSALKNYSDWVHTWYKKETPTPQWFKDCFNFLSVHPAFYYSDSEKKYLASEKLIGSEHVFQWAFWWDYPPRKDFFPGMNSTPGDYEYNKERGGLPPFKDEIKRIQNKKTKLTVYINQRFNWYKTKIGQSHGKEWAQMIRPGQYNMDFMAPGHGWDAGEGWNECIYAEGWQDYLIKTCERLVKDTGMYGVYLDEMAYLFPCYNPGHSHYKKGEVYSPELYARLMSGITEAMRRHNPEAILMGEHAGSDYYTQFFDGSWIQSYYSGGYPFAEKVYDDYNINFFRFYFPEFKLAEWGQSDAKSIKRCFFNGIGICWDWTSGTDTYLRDVGQVFKENGDAFASLKPEPLIETKKENIFANRFPIESKVVYTIYNKNEAKLNGDILEVDYRDNYHYVELLYDEEVRVKPLGEKSLISMVVRANDVVCLAQLPKVINVESDKEHQIFKITVGGELKDPHLFIFLDADDSYLSKNKGKRIEILGDKATVDIQKLFGKKGKIILKLLDGDKLIDELVWRVQDELR